MAEPNDATKKRPASVTSDSSSTTSKRQRRSRNNRPGKKPSKSTTKTDSAIDSASVSSDSSSASRNRRNRNLRLNKKASKSATTKTDSAINSASEEEEEEVNGKVNTAAFDQRRNSLGKAARDPRDEPPKKKKKTKKTATTPIVTNGSSAVATTSQQILNGTKTRSPSPVIANDGLSRPAGGTRQRLAVEQNPEREAERLEKMTGAVRTLLECIGEDPTREGILDTPKRHAEAMLFYTKGYQENVDDIVNGALFHEGHNEMVIVRDIEINTMCEHHLVPFNGKMHIGYIPRDTVIGLSKLGRIAEMFARRLQVQERLTKEVAQTIMEILKPQGVAVVMDAKHLCMSTRGVQQSNATTITSCVLGCFERKSKTRNEFFSLVGLNK